MKGILTSRRRLGIVVATVALGAATLAGSVAAFAGDAISLVTDRVDTTQGTRLMYSTHSTQVIYSDQGSAKLVNGRAVVQIDPLFQEAANLKVGYQVFLTPMTADTAGLGVVAQTPTSFEVRELNKGAHTFNFYWQINAVRRGFESDRMAPAPAASVPATNGSAYNPYAPPPAPAVPDKQGPDGSSSATGGVPTVPPSGAGQTP